MPCPCFTSSLPTSSRSCGRPDFSSSSTSATGWRRFRPSTRARSSPRSSATSICEVPCTSVPRCREIRVRNTGTSVSASRPARSSTRSGVISKRSRSSAGADLRAGRATSHSPRTGTTLCPLLAAFSVCSHRSPSRRSRSTRPRRRRTGVRRVEVDVLDGRLVEMDVADRASRPREAALDEGELQFDLGVGVRHGAPTAGVDQAACPATVEVSREATLSADDEVGSRVANAARR